MMNWIMEHLFNTDAVKNYLVGLVVQFPWGALAVFAMAGFRSAMKPFMVYLEDLVQKSGNEKLIQQMESVKKSKAANFGHLLLDWFASIKLDVVKQALAIQKAKAIEGPKDEQPK